MGEITINTHNFEVAKRGLKEFSQKQAGNMRIPHVNEKGWFGPMSRFSTS